MMKGFNKKENLGITLIALVITIIVLLVLAGITIAELSGSGLFEKAKESKEKYKNAQNDENDNIAKYKNEIDTYIAGNRDVELTDEVKDYIDTAVNTNFNSKVKIGKTSLVGTNNNTVYVPFDNSFPDDNYSVNFNVHVKDYYNNLTYAIQSKTKDGFTLHVTTSNGGSGGYTFTFDWIAIHN